MMTRARQWAEALAALTPTTNVDALATAFVDLCTDSGSAHEVPAVLRHLERMADDERRAGTLVITSAHQLAPQSMARIRALTGAVATTPVEVRTDADVVGGFVAEYRGMIYNASLARQIERLQASLMSTR